MRRIAQVRLIGALVLGALCASSASGQTIEELVRVKGRAKTTLGGIGLVVGLPGTGDRSKDSYVAARPYREFLANLDNPIGTLDELDAANAYAIVYVTAEVSDRGGTQGDQVDVRVDKLFNASSLDGGQLVTSLLFLPVRNARTPYAAASGGLVVQGDDPSSAVVRGGAQLLRDVGADSVVNDTGHMWLAIEAPYAGFDTARLIAGAINEHMAGDGAFGAVADTEIAVPESDKLVRIRLPEADRPRPVPFIAEVLRVPLDYSLIKTPARVLVNREANHIIADAHIMVRPVAITHGDLRLRPVIDPANPVPDPTAATDPGSIWIGFDTTDRQTTATTRLRDLLDALEALNVPTAAQIDIIYDLKRQGALIGEVIE